ncbi:MAG: acyltransferase [Candidatus Rokubacteria bacterium]|nr:acyltransferase [Candidatus Rokubacteria bacterium]
MSTSVMQAVEEDGAPAEAHATTARISPRGAQTYVSELDGVRAMAVWMVIVGHLVAGWPNPEGSLTWIPRPILFVLDHGWLGVDLFFVLSGFLITGILLDTRDHPFYFRNFYARRFLRIFPLYYAVIGITGLYYRDADGYFLISIFFLANFAYYFGVSVPHGPEVFWSLAVEEQFYIAWPWLVRLLSRRALTAMACALVVGVPFLRLYATHRGMSLEWEIYMYTWFRIDGLAVGALLAVWVRSRFNEYGRSLKLASSLVGLSIAITFAGVPFGILGSGSPFRYTQVQLVFGAFLLAAVTLRGTRWTSPLRGSFAKLSGDLSYCMYLIHLCVGDVYEDLVHRAAWQPATMLGPFGAVLLRSIVVVGVSFGLALLSWRFFERPILRLKRHFEYAPASRAPRGVPGDNVVLRTGDVTVVS